MQKRDSDLFVDVGVKHTTWLWPPRCSGAICDLFEVDVVGVCITGGCCAPPATILDDFVVANGQSGQPIGM